MTDHVSKVVDLVLLLQNNQRVTIRRIQEEIGLSRRTAYRYAGGVAARLSMCVENGVVVKDDTKNKQRTPPRTSE